jgi:hypothetical protein
MARYLTQNRISRCVTVRAAKCMLSGIWYVLGGVDGDILISFDHMPPCFGTVSSENIAGTARDPPSCLKVAFQPNRSTKPPFWLPFNLFLAS